MDIVAPGQINLAERSSIGSRNVNCFEMLEKIGQGTYGQVFRARDKQTGEIVALKKLFMDDSEKEGFPITAIRELKILKSLQHENVVELKEIVTSQGTRTVSFYMVFEYLDHDLAGLSKAPGVRFTIPQIKCYMKQLLTGLQYLHSNHVLHRDIKGANLLIDNRGILKIADFGLARVSFSQYAKGNLTNCVVTIWYRAPELLLGSTQYGPAIDMWSVGCIFAALLHGSPILPGKNETDQMGKIIELCGYPDENNWPGVSRLPLYKNFKPPEFPVKSRIREVFKKFDEVSLRFLESMLTLDPSKRISAKDALYSEYFCTDPLPCSPSSLPKYDVSSHELQIKQRLQEGRQEYDQRAKRYNSRDFVPPRLAGNSQTALGYPPPLPPLPRGSMPDNSFRGKMQQNPQGGPLPYGGQSQRRSYNEKGGHEYGQSQRRSYNEKRGHEYGQNSWQQRHGPYPSQGSSNQGRNRGNYHQSGRGYYG